VDLCQRRNHTDNVTPFRIVILAPCAFIAPHIRIHKISASNGNRTTAEHSCTPRSKCVVRRFKIIADLAIDRRTGCESEPFARPSRSLRKFDAVAG
jgi:hypothetical protein